MLKYSWIWLGKTKKLTKGEYLERRKWFNSLFNQKQKYKKLQNPIYTDSINILASHVFPLPVGVEKLITMGFKTISTTSTLIWLLTPLTVFRFYFPVVVKFRGPPLSNSAPWVTLQKKKMWLFPKYSWGKSCVSRWTASRTFLSSAIAYSLFSFAVSFSIIGYNYSVNYKKGCLVFTLGYSHTNIIKIPKGIFIKTINKRQLQLYGPNKLIVTSFASRLLNLKKLNIFTGKGLKLDSKSFKIKKRGS